MRKTPIRDWLAGTIRAAWVASDPSSSIPTRATCAADAILNACRREELFIMERSAADQLLEDARSEAGYEQAQRAGERLYVHPCGSVGPLTDETRTEMDRACYVCDVGTEGWQPLYVRKAADDA